MRLLGGGRTRGERLEEAMRHHVFYCEWKRSNIVLSNKIVGTGLNQVHIYQVVKRIDLDKNTIYINSTMMVLGSIMKSFIDSIRMSVQEKNWFAALFISLSMPDICAVTENPKTKKGQLGAKYQDWFNRYLKEKYEFGFLPATHFTAHDCWLFRCYCLHSGLNAESKKRMMSFRFTPPVRDGWQIHLNNNNGVLQLQIDIFANDMCAAVEAWLDDVKDICEVQSRINELMRIDEEPLVGIVKY